MFPGKAVENQIVVTEFPHEIIELPIVWIPLADGTCLAARIWRPAGNDTAPVPAILEYIPYRRRDGRLVDDELIHPYFAGHGFAGVRVDIRGTGDSDGLIHDEYLLQEQDDAVEVIAWLAAQPWCDGNVGMMGLSWGGFNSLQLAARQPPALKAIISVGATVDRYNDDVHYRHGCMLNEHFGWGSSFMSFCTRPPDPDVVGDKWRDMWLERLDNLPFFPETWLAHPLRDAYWRHGSVCENYDAIQIPVLIVSGWADLYVNAIPRLLENLGDKCHAIAGPWPHQYPHLVTPGPALDFLGEAVNWWSQWLQDEPAATFAMPRYRGFMQLGERPRPFASSLAGGWQAASQWPNSATETKTFHLGAQRLSLWGQIGAKPLSLRSPLDVGAASGELIPHCMGPEMPQDQREDDAGSLIFDSPTLDEAFSIWGDPILNLTLTSDAPTGQVIVRLCDVAPDGSSQLVTRGMLNLLMREGDDKAVAVPVGEAIAVEIVLDHVAHQFPAGHRVRVALSTAYWPMVWPAQDDVTLLVSAESTLTLPQYNGNHPISFEPSHVPPLPNTVTLREAKNERRMVRDQGREVSRFEIVDDYGEVEFADNGMINSGVKRETYEIAWEDVLSGSAEFHWTQELKRGSWQVRTETKTRLTCDRENFYLSAEVVAFEGEKQIWQKEWQTAISRLSG